MQSTTALRTMQSTIHPVNITDHHISFTYAFDTLYQHTQSIRPVNTSCQHLINMTDYYILLTHPINHSINLHITHGLYLHNNNNHRLGDDPGPLRFQYGAEGAKLAQVMCVIFVVGLLVLASTSVDFFYGLIVVLVLGVGTFVGM